MERLIESIRKDCKNFNPLNCNMTMLSGCDSDGQCRHIEKFNWIIERAKHYEEVLNIPSDKIISSWEDSRNYWYMSYYQDCEQPKLDTGKVRIFETVEDLHKSLENKKFRCPLCGGISNSPYVCDSGQEMSKGKICDWKVYGLFKDLGKGIYVYCKQKLIGETIFMPIAWEPEENHNEK